LETICIEINVKVVLKGVKINYSSK